MNYGKAFCKYCGKSFIVLKPRQIFCSRLCTRDWRNHLRRWHYHKDMEWLNCKYEELLGQIQKMNEQFLNQAKEIEKLGTLVDELKADEEKADKETNDSDNSDYTNSNDAEDIAAAIYQEYQQRIKRNEENKDIPANHLNKNIRNPRVKTSNEIRAKSSTTTTEKSAKQAKVKASAERKPLIRSEATKNYLKPVNEAIAMRKCHDCGAPTYNYRCEACLQKWREKNNVNARSNFLEYEE